VRIRLRLAFACWKLSAWLMSAGYWFAHGMSYAEYIRRDPSR
jgi:hypothetical protein